MSRDSNPRASTMATAGRYLQQESITDLVVRKTLCLLLQDRGMNRIKVLRLLDPDPSTAPRSLSDHDKEEAQVAEEAARKIKQLIEYSSSNVVSTVEQFERDGWVLTMDDVREQFAEVARTLFADDITWGRMVAFHGFAASYCVHATQQGIQEDIVESVCQWTTRSLQREVIQRWFVDHPWDQFAKYAEVQLARSNGVRQHPDPTFMGNIRDVGEFGVVVGALTLIVWSANFEFKIGLYTGQF